MRPRFNSTLDSVHVVTIEPLESRRLMAAAPAVAGFTLINADTDQPIASFSPLKNGAVLDLASLPTRHLNLRADAGAGTACVKFSYDAKTNYRVESAAPFALASNDGPDYFAWTPTVGAHTVRATPYSQKKAAGTAGAVKAVNFTVVDSGQAPKAPAVAVSSATTGEIALKWPAASSSVRDYRVTYTPGAYFPNGQGDPKTIELDAKATAVKLPDLQSFTMYSIDVTAVGNNGKTATTHVNAWTAAPATLKRYLYSVELPKEHKGFKTLMPQIQVYDIAAGHKWVKSIPLPSSIYNVRGVAANPITGRLYLSFFNSFKDGYQTGGLLSLDMATEKVVWLRRYDKSEVPSPDRFDLTPDGKTIYMPVGENGPDNFWVVIDAATGEPTGRITHVTAPHNTIVSLDGRRAFLAGQEKGTPVPPDQLHTVAVVDTATNRIVSRVGPFKDVVRPFTVNGKGTLVFANVNNFVGFQIGDVASGKILYTVAPPNYTQPKPADGQVYSHGIALTPDEKQVWVTDRLKVGIHVWDVSNLKSGPPKYLGFVPTRKTGLGLDGKPDPAAYNDTNSVPQWIVPSYDGRYMYPESGEIIEVATRRIVGQLRDKVKNAAGDYVLGPYAHSRLLLEIDFDDGKFVRATNQFGIGRVR